jgi:nardilysin
LNRNYILRSMQVIKEDIERAYRNANMKPLKHSAYLRLQALKERFWHADDKLACLLSLTVKDVTDFIPQLFNQTYIEALCHGNLDEEEALKIANIFKQTLVKNVLPPELRPQERIIKLPIGSSLLHSANVKNESEENSVVEMYFQGEQDLGRDSIRTRGIIDLFEQMIYEPCFNQLRTKEQLGYRVDCGVRVTYRVLGFCFRVQSAKYTPPFLEHRINTFIASLSQVLEEMTDEEFTSYKTALVELKLERDHSLLDETDRHWEQIWDQRYLFDARKLEASELLTISKSEVSEWFSHFLDSSSAVRRKLSIHIWGCNAQAERNNRKDNESTEDGDVTVINDLQAFKHGKELFPVLV